MEGKWDASELFFLEAGQSLLGVDDWGIFASSWGRGGGFLDNNGIISSIIKFCTFFMFRSITAVSNSTRGWRSMHQGHWRHVTPWSRGWYGDCPGRRIGRAGLEIADAVGVWRVFHPTSGTQQQKPTCLISSDLWFKELAGIYKNVNFQRSSTAFHNGTRQNDDIEVTVL